MSIGYLFGALVLEFMAKIVMAAFLWLLDAAEKGWTEFSNEWVIGRPRRVCTLGNNEGRADVPDLLRFGLAARSYLEGWSNTLDGRMEE